MVSWRLLVVTETQLAQAVLLVFLSPIHARLATLYMVQLVPPQRHVSQLLGLLEILPVLPRLSVLVLDLLHDLVVVQD